MGKYLNESNYQKTKSKLRILGVILLFLGLIALIASIVLVILGFTHMGNSVVSGFNNIESGSEHTGLVVGMSKSFGFTSAGFFVGFIGFVFFIAGIFILTLASRREIIAFNAQQALPVEREIIDEITPTAAKSAEEIARGIKKGLKEGKK